MGSIITVFICNQAISATTCPAEASLLPPTRNQKPQSPAPHQVRGSWDTIKSEMYGNHRGRNVCSDLSQHAFPHFRLRHAYMWRFKCKIQVRGFKMTLTETLKYGNINVHSVKWVKYHMGNTYSILHSLIQWTPASSWNWAQPCSLGLIAHCTAPIANSSP